MVDYILVDADDVALVTAHRWTVSATGHVKRYVRIDGKQRPVMLHREIVGVPRFPGPVAADRIEVDHINGDPRDNRKANLRVVTHGQNLQNLRLSKHNTSGYRGVSWSSNSRRWRACVQIEGRTRHVGFFIDKHEAALAAAEFRARHLPFSVEPLLAAVK